MRTRARARLGPFSEPTHRTPAGARPAAANPAGTRYRRRCRDTARVRRVDRGARAASAGRPGRRRPALGPRVDPRAGRGSPRAHRPRPAPARRDAPPGSCVGGLAIPHPRARRVLAPGDRDRPRPACSRGSERDPRHVAPGCRRRGDWRGHRRARRGEPALPRGTVAGAPRSGRHRAAEPNLDDHAEALAPAAAGPREPPRRSGRPTGRRAASAWRRSLRCSVASFPWRCSSTWRARARGRSRSSPARRDRTGAAALSRARVCVQARVAPGGGPVVADARARRDLYGAVAAAFEDSTRRRSTTTSSVSPTTTRRAGASRRRSRISSGRPCGRRSSVPARVRPSCGSARASSASTPNT